MITMTRRLTFSSALADWMPSLSQAENEAIFGPEASPEPYGHNYTLDVSVKGSIHQRTGILVNIKEIDKIVKNRIVQVLDRKLLNRRVSRFETEPPTLENLTLFVADELRDALPAEVMLSAIRLEDTATRYATWEADANENAALTARGNIHRNTGNMLLTRVYEFSASHRLHSPHLSDEANRELFGKCNYDNGHGHNYEVEITVSGPVDPRSGRVIEPDALDAVVNKAVLDRYDHRHLNYDIPEFAGLVPSAEVITRVIWEQIAPHLTGSARLYRVLVRETQRNIFEYYGEAAPTQADSATIANASAGNGEPAGKDEDVQ